MAGLGSTLSSGVCLAVFAQSVFVTPRSALAFYFCFISRAFINRRDVRASLGKWPFHLQLMATRRRRPLRSTI